jgi:hypothetical protein
MNYGEFDGSYLGDGTINGITGGGGDNLDTYLMDPLSALPDRGLGFDGPWIADAGVTLERSCIGGGKDGKFKIATGEIARKLAVGSAWNKLRMCVRVALDTTGVDLTGYPTFYFGVMSDPAASASGVLTNGYAGATRHWLGALCNRTSGYETPWTYAGGSYHTNGGTSWVTCAAKVAGTLAYGNVTGQGLIYISNQRTLHRTLLFLEIEKGTPWTVRMVFAFAAGADQDWSQSQIIAALNKTAMSGDPGGDDVLTYLGTTNYSDIFTPGTITPDEATNGYFNAVEFGWSTSEVAMYLSDFAFRIVS